MKLFTEKTIRDRQAWVKDHPARVKEELTALGYTLDVTVQKGFILRTVLSIDLFTAPLAWRCEIASMYPSKLPRLLSSMTMAQMIFAHDVAKELLSGVGEAEREILSGKNAISFEIAHPCTPEEAEYVVKAALRPAALFESVPVGELNEYDLSSASQVAGWWDGKEGKQQGLYLPTKRSLIYERPGNQTDN